MMSRFFFDCLVDDHFHSDAFGVTMSDRDISDQAQAVLLNLLQEALPTEKAKSITVTVRDERGSPVYVTQAMVSQHRIAEAAGPEAPDASGSPTRESAFSRVP